MIMYDNEFETMELKTKPRIKLNDSSYIPLILFQIFVVVVIFMFYLLVLCILVIGALLGTQDGRNIEIFNSFELQFDLFDDGQIVINMEYYRTKEEQCKLIKTLKPPEPPFVCIAYS